MHIHLHVVFTRYELRKVLETNYAQVQFTSSFQTGKLWSWEAKESCPSLHGVSDRSGNPVVLTLTVCSCGLHYPRERAGHIPYLIEADILFPKPLLSLVREPPYLSHSCCEFQQSTVKHFSCVLRCHKVQESIVGGLEPIEQGHSSLGEKQAAQFVLNTHSVYINAWVAHVHCLHRKQIQDSLGQATQPSIA